MLTPTLTASVTQENPANSTPNGTAGHCHTLGDSHASDTSHNNHYTPTTAANAPWDRRLAAAFAPIDLAALNAKADMLQRLDNKYVVTAAALAQALPQLATHFDILQIDGRRDFTYQTCYFDDARLGNYFDQLRGRRKRCKVRMRRYLEANLCFVEIKLKGKRGITDKKRLACDPAHYGHLDDAAEAFIARSWNELYGSTFEQQLDAVLEMRYRRLTLVAKQGGERMTIDYALNFYVGDNVRQAATDVCLLETKSANANGIADKILRQVHLHPTGGCSKYCMAMAATGQVSRYNKFLAALRKLDLLPDAYVARVAAYARPQRVAHAAHVTTGQQQSWLAGVTP